MMELPTGPYLRLLGPVKLIGAVTVQPDKSIPKLLEMLLWLLEHPGRNPKRMTEQLFMAAGTERSYLSRLRKWLGKTPDGQDYLGKAYSGKIFFNKEIGSDYLQAQEYLSSPVARSPDRNIIAALRMVRGKVLEDVQPGQWHWAEFLREELTTQLTGAAITLAERVKLTGNNELGLWATLKGLLVSPSDEELYREVNRLAYLVDSAALPSFTAKLLLQHRRSLPDAR